MTSEHLKLNLRLHNLNCEQRRRRGRVDPLNQSVKTVVAPQRAWLRRAEGIKKRFPLFKLPIKWCGIRGSDGWIHRPCSLPIKWLHPNSNPPTTTSSKLCSLNQLMGLMCRFLCLLTASTSCHVSHGRGERLVTGKHSYQSLRAVKQTLCSCL